MTAPPDPLPEIEKLLAPFEWTEQFGKDEDDEESEPRLVGWLSRWNGYTLYVQIDDPYDTGYGEVRLTGPQQTWKDDWTWTQEYDEDGSKTRQSAEDAVRLHALTDLAPALVTELKRLRGIEAAMNATADARVEQRRPA